MAESNLWQLYRLMLRSRVFEEVTMELWEEGKIFGEMHMGIGEEAINAAVISQLTDGDAIAADHRGTAPFFMRGVDPIELILEFLGDHRGLCGGMGGHMHLFSKDHLIASSGIVGSAGPAANGFALAMKYKNKKTNNIAVAFFGDGAANQGMLLESLNLASAWKLPVLFVCKDNGWAITTLTAEVTGGNLVERAKGFGIDAVEVDGLDVEESWKSINMAITQIRKKGGPFFIHAKCVHKEGHFLGDPLLAFHKTTKKAFGEVTGPLLRSVISKKGASILKRGISLINIFSLISKSGQQTKKSKDPLIIIRKKLEKDKDQLTKIEVEVSTEINDYIKKVSELTEGGHEQ